MSTGVRSTQGSPIFADNIAEAIGHTGRDISRREGAIVYAMSNTPEFGAGANTFNEVFGRTLNPWNTSRSASGSSGGAAVALATGMAWVAHGSDIGGSLRNPASFCGVAGMRPSPGRVAASVHGKIDGTLGVEGPMARNVEDLALLFDAMMGEDPGDPLSLPSGGHLLSGRGPLGRKTQARRLQPRSRHHAGRCGSGGDRRARRLQARERRRHRRGSASRSQRGA